MSSSKSKKKTPGLTAALSSLETFGGVSIAEMASGVSDASTQKNDGRALEIELSEISEDPNQPRKSFDERTLKELADSIKEIGVLQAISVRRNAEGPGYILNYGARRFRAARLAGLTTIPAFIHNPSTKDSEIAKYAQMAENIHRDNLTPLEIASFIHEEVIAGKKKAQIAKTLGKSRPYVNQYSKLAEGPDWIKKLAADGICTDVTALNDLIYLEENGTIENLQDLISNMESVTRSTIKNLSTKPSADELDASGQGEPASSADSADASGQGESASSADSADASGQGEPASSADSADASGQGESASSADSADASGQGEPASAPVKEPEPKLDKAVFIGGRRAYLQSTKIKVWWDDTGTFESIPLKDLPQEAFEG